MGSGELSSYSWTLYDFTSSLSRHREDERLDTHHPQFPDIVRKDDGPVVLSSSATRGEGG